ncbi:MAG TPA: ATP-binding protein [Nitrospira sp.]|nr:ATP-binding protein [Nitrospira sp.]
MTARPTGIVAPPSSSTDLLDLVTRFSTEMGAMTDPGVLSEHIIQELCRAGAATHGALYLLDRERECYRRAGTVGPIAKSGFPATLPHTHPIPHHLSLMTRTHTATALSSDVSCNHSDEAELAAMATMQVERGLPHVSRGRLIAFSLLGAPLSPERNHTSMSSLLNALAQSATNALDTSLLLEDLHRSHLLMKRTDRLKSLETIAGGFAHEIRNPLTSIKTFIQLAPERKDDPDFIREFSRIVLDDVYRIERLIEEILDYARYMEPKLTEEDVNDIVSSCSYFIEVKADSRGIKIEKELASDLPRVMLDRQQIKQVFLNLFLNALDAMGEQGGTLRVRTRKLTKPGGKAWVQIETEDTGHGIQDVNLEHIFDPFFTTKHESGEHEGTGLGLTIVHQIIQEHHGEIEVKSTVGTGTTFFVNLPAIPS